MRYAYATESECTAISRQEALDRGVPLDAVTKYWYEWRETATPGVWAIIVDDNKNPIATGMDESGNGIATVETEPVWPVYEMR